MRIELFFDIGSPYSYLAATQMEALTARTGVPVRWRPFLLGGVFKASGNVMPASVPSKARWMLSDLERWARHYGVPFRMASRFPPNTLTAQRALTAVGQREGDAAIAPYALALFRAFWVDDRDVTAPDVVAAVASACGHDGPAIVAATADTGVKDALRETTDEAVRRGAFGAPTFFLGDAMFWGNDRIELIEEAIRGG